MKRSFLRGRQTKSKECKKAVEERAELDIHKVKSWAQSLDNLLTDKGQCCCCNQGKHLKKPKHIFI